MKKKTKTSKPETKATVLKQPPPKKNPWLERLPGIVLILSALYLIAGFVPPASDLPIDVKTFAQLPVLSGGRVKPLDTVARTSLLVLSGKQTVHVGNESKPAIGWLLDVLYSPVLASAYSVFEIDDPDVLAVMGMQASNQRRFSFADLEPHLAEIGHQAARAEQVKPEQRTRFQSAILNLGNSVDLYQRLQNNLFLENTAVFYMLPVRGKISGRVEWLSVGTGLVNHIKAHINHPGVKAYIEMGKAYRAADGVNFDRAARAYHDWLATIVPDELARGAYEWRFNYYEPFYKSIVLYVLVFLLASFSWLANPKPLARAAYQLLILVFALHTAGLISRMILQGRPPVTNLYSSAIFVGWVAVGLGIILERFYKNGIGSAMSSAIGFMTLVIAQHLAAEGDTLEMMRAVLDSNFWLATHVVCITIGYGSTFLAGFLATLYIFRQRFDSHWNNATAQSLERMVYGIVCFATFFSFFGTILGGIWADQSWGRFWGWDPKENGALMIVLWNAFILHARWGGIAKRKTLMALAVFGNIVTSLSWFGVNMLGIGLHSYGFMEKAFVWLTVFVITQFGVIGLGLASKKT